MDRCDNRCEEAGPYGPCLCSKCNGRFHGVAKITVSEVLKLCDRKLRDHRLTAEAIVRWEKMLRLAMELEKEDDPDTRRAAFPRRRRRMARVARQ